MLNLENEIWKEIPKYEGYYEASNLGRIRSIKREINGYSARGKRIVKIQRKSVLKRQFVRLGYPYVSLDCDGKMRNFQTHALILSAFKGVRPLNMQGCHNNGIKTDNRIENLRWDTRESNLLDIEKHGHRLRGEQVASAKLTREEVKKIIDGVIGCAAAVKLFKIGRTQFYRIKRGESWASCWS